MSTKKEQALQKRATRLKLKDLAQAKEVQVKAWELDDPERTYHARAVGVTGSSREVTATFAQRLPGSGRVVNAVSVSMPRSDMVQALGGFAAIRERLRRLALTDEEMGAASLDVKDLEPLDQQSYLALQADILRAASGDEMAVLDFFSGPLITGALIEARPDARIDFRPQIRIVCSSLVLAAFLQEAEREVNRDGS